MRRNRLLKKWYSMIIIYSCSRQGKNYSTIPIQSIRAFADLIATGLKLIHVISNVSTVWVN